jgi:hypothetical protein
MRSKVVFSGDQKINHEIKSWFVDEIESWFVHDIESWFVHEIKSLK